MKKYILLVAFSLVLLISFSLVEEVQKNDGKLHLVICDVGEGDGILIRTPQRKTIVIDGGPDDKILTCLSRHLPFWDKTIDLMLLTHPHADHLTGLVYVLKRYTVIQYATENAKNQTAIAKAMESVLAVKKMSARFLFSNDHYHFPDGTSLLTLWPDKTWLANQQIAVTSANFDVNGVSLIELLQYGNFSALITGDAGFLAEEKIGSAAGHVNVLKVPHHGSLTGMSKQFLSMISPSLAVISVGKNNTYGHPTPYSLTLLQKAGIRTFRTDKNGEVEIITNGKTYTVKSEN